MCWSRGLLLTESKRRTDVVARPAGPLPSCMKAEVEDSLLVFDVLVGVDELINSAAVAAGATSMLLCLHVCSQPVTELDMHRGGILM